VRRLDADALDGLLDVEPTGAFPVTVPLPPVAEAPAVVGWDERLVRRMVLAAAAGFVVAGAVAGAGAGWSVSRRAEARAANAPTQPAARAEPLTAGGDAAGGGSAEPAGSLTGAAELPAERVGSGSALNVDAADPARSPAGAAPMRSVIGAADPARSAAAAAPTGSLSVGAAPSTAAPATRADAGVDRWVVRFGFGAEGPEVGWEATVAAAARCAGRLEVVGYTCDAGDPAFNQDLSERRARVVASALAAAGVPTARLRARGGGPLDAADSPRRADRRRVELRCVPTT
jgi:hypothetical protein